jgi:hypothetical protein
MMFGVPHPLFIIVKLKISKKTKTICLMIIQFWPEPGQAKFNFINNYEVT